MRNSVDAAIIRILLIEPNPADAAQFEEWLSAASSPAFEVRRAPSFEQGLPLARDADAVLLGMPMIDVENLPRVSRMRDAAPAVPLVILLGHAKEVAMLEALRLGAQDLLVKTELDDRSLRRRIRFAITRKHDERLHRMLGAADGRENVSDEALDIADAVGSACLLLQGYAATQRVRIQVDVPDGLPRLTSDRDRLRQILINLVSNAIQFTPPAGKVTVSAALNASGELELCIADTGVGMPKSQLALIGRGEDATILDIRAAGSRGLPLTEYLVGQHGGRLRGDAALGEGTKITAVFPTERLIQGGDATTVDSRKAG